MTSPFYDIPLQDPRVLTAFRACANSCRLSPVNFLALVECDALMPGLSANFLTGLSYPAIESFLRAYMILNAVLRWRNATVHAVFWWVAVTVKMFVEFLIL